MDDATPLPRRRPIDRSGAALAGLALAFAVLAGLVLGGALTRLDRHAVAHWMPGFDPSRAHHVIPPVSGIFMPFALDSTAWEQAADVFTYPASVLVSILVYAAGCAVLLRRGDRAAALVWAVVWPAANVVEVALKAAIERPALYGAKHGTLYHVRSFDHSFPSGHSMRAVLVAGLVWYVWRRLGPWAAAWAALGPAALVVSSAHVPSDTAGGVLLGLVVVLLAFRAVPRVRARRGGT
jgi:membrane-associated phospholipid phosphatase